MKKKLKWSPLLTFCVFLILSAIISLFISLLMKKSVLIELEIITGLVSLLIFSFLSVILYHDSSLHRLVLCNTFRSAFHFEDWKMISYNFSLREKLSFQEFLHPDIEYGSDVEG